METDAEAVNKSSDVVEHPQETNEGSENVEKSENVSFFDGPGKSLHSVNAEPLSRFSIHFRIWLPPMGHAKAKAVEGRPKFVMLPVFAQ